jgi:hypothetical protein
VYINVFLSTLLRREGGSPHRKTSTGAEVKEVEVRMERIVTKMILMMMIMADKIETVEDGSSAPAAGTATAPAPAATATTAATETSQGSSGDSSSLSLLKETPAKDFIINTFLTLLDMRPKADCCSRAPHLDTQHCDLYEKGSCYLPLLSFLIESANEPASSTISSTMKKLASFHIPKSKRKEISLQLANELLDLAAEPAVLTVTSTATATAATGTSRYIVGTITLLTLIINYREEIVGLLHSRRLPDVLLSSYLGVPLGSTISSTDLCSDQESR